MVVVSRSCGYRALILQLVCTCRSNVTCDVLQPHFLQPQRCKALQKKWGTRNLKDCIKKFNRMF